MPALRNLAMLQHEVRVMQHWLDGFYPGPSQRTRFAALGRTGEYIVIHALPLPDGYEPDEIDALLLVDNFPSLPPIGLYVLNACNEEIVRQLRRQFNAFQNQAFHAAPSIRGYTWICYHYADNRWHYNPANPARGDNLAKFLASFFAQAKP